MLVSGGAHEGKTDAPIKPEAPLNERGASCGVTGHRKRLAITVAPHNLSRGQTGVRGRQLQQQKNMKANRTTRRFKTLWHERNKSGRDK